MSGIEQGGLMFLAVFVLIVLNWGGPDRGSRIRNEDADQWWYGRRNWHDPRS